MSWIGSIIEALNNVSDFFYDLYLDARDWPLGLDNIAWLFYGLSITFNRIAWAFYDLGTWAYDVQDRLAGILSFDEIRRQLKLYLDYAVAAWSWVTDAWLNVTDIVDDWWLARSVTIRSWIDTATQGLSELRAAWEEFRLNQLPRLEGDVATLYGRWRVFWTETLPNLVNFTQLGEWWNGKTLDIQLLINGAFTLREGMWQGWQDLRGQVAELFADPEKWLLEKIESLIVRYW